jgi:hypothetical protein
LICDFVLVLKGRDVLKQTCGPQKFNPLGIWLLFGRHCLTRRVDSEGTDDESSGTSASVPSQGGRTFMGMRRSSASQLGGHTLHYMLAIPRI